MITEGITILFEFCDFRKELEALFCFFFSRKLSITMVNITIPLFSVMNRAEFEVDNWHGRSIACLALSISFLAQKRRFF